MDSIVLDAVTPTASSDATSGASGGSGASGTVSVSYSAAVMIPPPLQAHSTVDTANWDAKHPRFFSGTNCSVSGGALAYTAPPGNNSYPAGGKYIKQAMLSIGGTAVKFYDDASVYGPFPLGTTVGTNQFSVPLSVFFDSTHFADGSTIPAQMTVTDSGGLTYTVNLSGTACNNVLAVANRTYSWVDVYTNQNVAENAASGAVQGTLNQ